MIKRNKLDKQRKVKIKTENDEKKKTDKKEIKKKRNQINKSK